MVSSFGRRLPTIIASVLLLITSTAQAAVVASVDRSKKHKGIACFVVDADTPGVKAGRKEDKMGQRRLA